MDDFAHGLRHNIIPVAGAVENRMKKRRGNPNWGKPDVRSMTEIQPSSFEKIVRKLHLSPEQYIDSVQLKDWVRKNKDQRYVPSDLLKAWGFEAAGDV
jgi:hypothetical protein